MLHCPPVESLNVSCEMLDDWSLSCQDQGNFLPRQNKQVGDHPAALAPSKKISPCPGVILIPATLACSASRDL